MGAQRQPVPACGPLLKQTSVSKHPGAQQRSHTQPNLKHLNDQSVPGRPLSPHVVKRVAEEKLEDPGPLPPPSLRSVQC